VPKITISSIIQVPLGGGAIGGLAGGGGAIGGLAGGVSTIGGLATYSFVNKLLLSIFVSFIVFDEIEAGGDAEYRWKSADNGHLISTGMLKGLLWLYAYETLPVIKKSSSQEIASSFGNSFFQLQFSCVQFSR